MRLLTKKLLVVIIVVGGILAATGIYVSSHPMVQESSGSVPSIAPEEEETIVIPEEANLTQNYTIPSQVLYKGQTYQVIKKDLEFLGPETPVCPYCSSNSTTQTGTSTQGNYWFYYYHCHTCNRYFTTYAGT
ncbi:MAG: hypothetical protein ABFC91_05855 [Methanobacteriaceae archaeon]